jgi:hypothetical protein
MRNRQSNGASAARLERDIHLFLSGHAHLEDVGLKELEVMEQVERILDHELLDAMDLVLEHWFRYRPNGMDQDDALGAQPVLKLQTQLRNIMRARLRQLVQKPVAHKGSKEILEHDELDRERLLHSLDGVPDARVAELVLLSELSGIADHGLLRGLEMVLGHYIWERSQPAEQEELDAAFPLEQLRRMLHELSMARLRDALQKNCAAAA